MMPRDIDVTFVIAAYNAEMLLPGRSAAPLRRRM